MYRATCMVSLGVDISGISYLERGLAATNCSTLVRNVYDHLLKAWRDYQACALFRDLSLCTHRVDERTGCLSSRDPMCILAFTAYLQRLPEVLRCRSCVL
jgi:hypothetical protein